MELDYIKLYNITTKYLNNQTHKQAKTLYLELLQYLQECVQTMETDEYKAGELVEEIQNTIYIVENNL